MKEAIEAAISNALPRGFNTASTIAKAMGRSENEIAPILEEMADKGLCMSREERWGIPEPPVDYKALKEAIKASIDI